jgi:hypothetical protein
MYKLTNLSNGGKKPMTICISMLCRDSKSVVVAADRMTTSNYPPMEFEHKKKKIRN